MAIERIAHRAAAGARGAALHELVVGLFLHEEPRTGAAALALVEEQREVRAFDGRIHVGVGEDDVGALAAEFQRDAFEVGFGGCLHDQVADLGRPGERHLIDVHVARDGRAGRRTVARQQVDHAGREARFENQFAHAQRRQRRLFGGLHHHGISR